MSKYSADPGRYDSMSYQRCGTSGLKLPKVTFGLWHNFGHVDQQSLARRLLLRAFDLGMTHFDLANNYGPPPGTAEQNFGRILKQDLAPYRDELIISTKAGYQMWEGPYGDWGSKKYLTSSLDQSLRRMGLDYVDIFYHHRPDPNTPIEESMMALDLAVKQGKALYAGISNYGPEGTKQASEILRSLGTPCLIHQFKYSLLEQSPEEGLLTTLDQEGIGGICFSPLGQGLLTDRYLDGIPKDSRAAKSHGFLRKESVTEELLEKLRGLQKISQELDLSLAQLALLWVLRKRQVTSVLMGASSLEQLEQNLAVAQLPQLDSHSQEAIVKVMKS